MAYNSGKDKTKENLQLILQELDILGFNSDISLENPENDVLDSFVSIVWNVTSAYKKHVSKINCLNEQVITLNRKINSLEEVKKKCVSDLQKSQEKVLKLQESLVLVRDDLDKLLVEKKNWKKEVASLQGALSDQLLQHQHEIRRKENTIERLENKLYSFVGFNNHKSDSKPETPPCNEVLDISICKKYITSLQDNIQTILGENVNLRASLVRIYETVMNGNGENCTQSAKQRLFNLPYESIINDIEKDINVLFNSEKLQ